MNKAPAQSQKHTLREAALARRAGLSASTVHQLSADLCAHLLAHFTQAPAREIGFCWPFRNEPDLRPVIASWRRQGADAALPVSDVALGTLRFNRWTPQSVMREDRYGIPYPADGEPMKPACLLIPMLAFDAQGYRLGYGAGWFDRTLADWQPRPLLIGVAFEIGRLESITPEAHDIAVDWLVTEAGVFRAKTAAA